MNNVFFFTGFFVHICLNCINSIKEWLANNYFQLNTEKTEVLISAPDGILPTVMDNLGFLSHVKPTLRNFGVHMGQALSLDQHVNSLLYQLRNVVKLSPVVQHWKWRGLYVRFPLSLIFEILFLLVLAIHPLQVVLNAAAKLLTKSTIRSHVTPILFLD